MRTNIDIDDDVLDAAMKAGAFKTKKDAVEAGLRLIARQAAYREILKWEGRLRWDGDDAEPPAPAASPPLATGDAAGTSAVAAHEPALASRPARRHAGR